MRARVVVVILAACAGAVGHSLLARPAQLSQPEPVLILGASHAPGFSAKAGAPAHRKDLVATPQWCPIPELAEDGLEDAS